MLFGNHVIVAHEGDTGRLNQDNADLSDLAAPGPGGWTSHDVTITGGGGKQVLGKGDMEYLKGWPKADDITGKPVEKPSDYLESYINEWCYRCGERLVRRCHRCGGPVCCPRCCWESTLPPG